MSVKRNMFAATAGGLLIVALVAGAYLLGRQSQAAPVVRAAINLATTTTTTTTTSTTPTPMTTTTTSLPPAGQAPLELQAATWVEQDPQTTAGLLVSVNCPDPTHLTQGRLVICDVSAPHVDHAYIALKIDNIEPLRTEYAFLPGVIECRHTAWVLEALADANIQCGNIAPPPPTTPTTRQPALPNCPTQMIQAQALKMIGHTACQRQKSLISAPNSVTARPDPAKRAGPPELSVSRWQRDRLG